jgi:hypothetical protein
MDPLLLEALRFGVAILAGGLVAVIAGRINFAQARQLSLEDRAREDADLLRALLAEMDENVAAVGPSNGTTFPTLLSRSAWDAARRVYIPDDVRLLISTAYVAATDLNNRIAIVDANAAQRSGDPHEDSQRQKNLSDDVIRRGAFCAMAFAKAESELRKILATAP